MSTILNIKELLNMTVLQEVAISLLLIWGLKPQKSQVRCTVIQRVCVNHPSSLDKTFGSVVNVVHILVINVHTEANTIGLCEQIIHLVLYFFFSSYLEPQ
jgi:NAD-dependent oxidoreductase involved in siderophore biosynthesis